MGVRCGGDVEVDSTLPAADAAVPETGGQAGHTGGGAMGGGGAAGHEIPTEIAYHFVQTRALASPLPTTTGITYDGKELWILALDSDSQSYDLIHFDPDTLVVDRSFSLTGLFATLGTQEYGIAWDGASVWVAVAGNTNLLALIDPLTGAVLKTMSSPAALGPVDLDFDGAYLWLSDGTGTEYRIDPINGGVLQHFPLIQARDNGNAYRAGELFIGDLFGSMEVYDAASGGSLGLVLNEDGSPFEESGPSVFVGYELVMLSHLGITYYATAKGP